MKREKEQINNEELFVELLVTKISLGLNKVRTWQHAQLFCNATYSRQMTLPLLSEILAAVDAQHDSTQLEVYFNELMLQIRTELCLLCSESGQIRFVSDVKQKLRVIIRNVVQQQIK